MAQQNNARNQGRRRLGGWLPNKEPAMGEYRRLLAQQAKIKAFKCDPSEPFWGFPSWNGVFTRQFKPGARPVAEPGNPKIIVSACEASPYAIKPDAQLHDRFWLKSQPYSLREIFSASQRECAQRFVGGSVYQAFLSALNYHRWHAPVSGTIAQAYLIDGTYYSDLEAEGEDPGGLNDSQGYTSAVAARAVIVIDHFLPQPPFDDTARPIEVNAHLATAR